MTNSSTLEQFKNSLSDRNPKTVKAYLVALRGFSKWLMQQPGEEQFSPTTITEVALRDYIAALEKQGKSRHTQRLVVSALRQYCNWGIRNGSLTSNPAMRVALPTVEAVAPTELSPDQRYALKVQVEKEQSARLSAIFALGYWTGLRIGEIAQLKRAHIQLTQRSGSLHVVDSKGGKNRQLDLHNESRRALSHYLRTGRRDVDSEYLFTSQRAGWLRQQGKADNLSARGIDHLWTKMKANAPFRFYELIADITMHALRHDFAHRARQSGWLLEEIAVYLGHQTNAGTPAIATTVRYTLPSRQQLKRRLKTLAG